MPFTSRPIQQSVDLRCTSNGSNKEYFLRIVEENGLYRVEANYGPTGRANRYEDKSKKLVSLHEATLKFDEVLAEKRNKKGYFITGTDPATQTSFRAQPPVPPARPATAPVAPAPKTVPTTIPAERAQLIASLSGGLPVF